MLIFTRLGFIARIKSTLVWIQIIIKLNLLIIFTLLFIHRKARRAERNSESQSRASSKVKLNPATDTEDEED